MLKITVELWPGGRESGRRTIATAFIVNVRGGALADYEVQFREETLGDVGEASVVPRAYPRWSATVWDLVARSISVALNGGNEKLPGRPQLPEVPVHESSGLQYVRFREIPEPTRTFKLRLRRAEVAAQARLGTSGSHLWSEVRVVLESGGLLQETRTNCSQGAAGAAARVARRRAVLCRGMLT